MADGHSQTQFEEDRAAMRALLNSKNHSSGELYHAAISYLDRLENAYGQACMNLATIRPSGIEGATIGDDQTRYRDALFAGWGGIEGWDDRAD